MMGLNVESQVKLEILLRRRYDFEFNHNVTKWGLE